MSFYTNTIRSSALFSAGARCVDIMLLEPETFARVHTVVLEAAVMGHALMVYETYRSQQRQKLLFDRRATHLEKVGVHHYGLACDLAKLIGGEPSWKGDFGFLGMLARKHGLVWGGDWGNPGGHHSFVDSVHLQRITVARQASLFAGIWYPDEGYDPYQDGAR